MKCKDIVKKHIDDWGLDRHESNIDIVREYLSNNDIDGLYCSLGDECGCGIDDLQHCSEDFSECETAKKRGEYYFPSDKGVSK